MDGGHGKVTVKVTVSGWQCTISYFSSFFFVFVLRDMGILADGGDCILVGLGQGLDLKGGGCFSALVVRVSLSPVGVN